jgi:hypothetical protein
MENDRQIFLNKLNDFIDCSKSINKREIKQKYLELVKQYHPDKNNQIDKNVLHEYMILINSIYKTIEERQENIETEKETTNSNYFYIQIFNQLFSQLITIYTNKETINNPKLIEYTKLFIMEINKYDKDAGKAFSFLLSNEMINNKNININQFIKGMTTYEQIFKNAYIYTEYYIKKIQITAKQYFYEFKKNNAEEMKNAIDIIEKWFNELIIKITK